MYQFLYKWQQIRRVALLCVFALSSASCAFGYQHPGVHEHHHGSGVAGHTHHGGSDHGGSGAGNDGYGGGPEAVVASNGLAIGAVVSATGRKALKPYQRWRYADKLASQILEVNPRMSGQVDSYEYVSRRMGKPFSTLVKRYRELGDLDGEALVALREAQLRRRYLMMASILPLDQTIPLTPDAVPVIGRLNEEVDDYYDVRYQTVRLQALRVQIYDTAAGQKLFDEVFRSDDGGVSLAAERSTRKYVGNSLVAALSNSMANGFRNIDHPPAPDADAVFEHVWRRVAEALPGGVR